MSGSGWIPRIGGCGPMWSGGRSPGTWRRPHPCSLWRGVVRNRSWRDAILTTDLPTDAVPPAKTQAAPDCCRLTHLYIPIRSPEASRAAQGTIQSGPLTALRAPARWSRQARVPGAVRARHPSGARCQRLTGRDRLPRCQPVHSGNTPSAAGGAAASWPAHHRPRLRARPRCPQMPLPARTGPAQMLAHAE